MSSTSGNNENRKSDFKVIPFSSPKENKDSKTLSERVSYNFSVLSGNGTLGEKIITLIHSADHNNSVNIETLFDPKTKKIVEVLSPEPNRVYEKTLTERSGYTIKIPVSLSETHPDGKLVIFEFEVHPRIAIKRFHSPFPLPASFVDEIQSAIDLANSKLWACAA